jgi:hypothetical protein
MPPLSIQSGGMAAALLDASRAFCLNSGSCDHSPALARC